MPLVEVNGSELYFGMTLETFLVFVLVMLILIVVVTILVLSCLGIILRFNSTKKVKQTEQISNDFEQQISLIYPK